ncbi:hypothetical protein Tco_0934718 [Tanacetum coccineum]
MDGLTLDGSFIPHSNFLLYQEKEQELETITEVVEIPSSQSTPLVPSPETPPLSTPESKENLEPNPSINYEAFYFDNDHIEEKSSGSTTTNSFIFDLSTDPLPPADRSDFYHEKFVDELPHIISPTNLIYLKK